MDIAAEFFLLFGIDHERPEPASGNRDLFREDRFRYACFVPRGRLRGTVWLDGTPIDRKRLVSTIEFSGALVNWKRVHKREPYARGEASMAWGLEATFHRPGPSLDVDVDSHDVLEYFPVDPTPTEEPFWGQTVARANVCVTECGPFSREKTRFASDAVLETMRNESGSTTTSFAMERRRCRPRRYGR